MVGMLSEKDLQHSRDRQRHRVYTPGQVERNLICCRSRYHAKNEMIGENLEMTKDDPESLFSDI